MKAANDFKAFILRGNVVDLAVGIIIGAAFGTVVTAFVKDLITPLIAAIGGKPDFAAIGFTINHSRFLVGDFTGLIHSRRRDKQDSFGRIGVLKPLYPKEESCVAHRTIPC